MNIIEIVRCTEYSVVASTGRWSGAVPARRDSKVKGPHMIKARRLTALMSSVVLLSGCQSDLTKQLFSESLWNPLGLKLPFATDLEPIRVGVVAEDSTLWDMRMWDVHSWWNFGAEQKPWSVLQRELVRYTGRPVQFEQLELFQVIAHLESGRLHFALLTQQQCARVREKGHLCEVVALSHPDNRAGLIVASAGSDIKSIQDLTGKRFAFGPKSDPVLHYAALATLNSGGVSINDIQREIVPLDCLQYHISSRESGREIVYGTTPAGVIEKNEYERFPETGGRFLPMRFSKDQFRVLAETKRLDVGTFVASTRTDPELVHSVRAFLVSAAERRPQVTSSLGVAGFTGPETSAGVSRGDTSHP